MIYQGSCNRCGVPVECDLGGLDYTFCRKCAKAIDVYRPPVRVA